MYLSYFPKAFSCHSALFLPLSKGHVEDGPEYSQEFKFIAVLADEDTGLGYHGWVPEDLCHT